MGLEEREHCKVSSVRELSDHSANSDRPFPPLVSPPPSSSPLSLSELQSSGHGRRRELLVSSEALGRVLSVIFWYCCREGHLSWWMLPTPRTRPGAQKRCLVEQAQARVQVHCDYPAWDLASHHVSRLLPHTVWLEACILTTIAVGHSGGCSC